LRTLNPFWGAKDIEKLDEPKIAFAANVFIIGKAQVHGTKLKVEKDCYR